MATYADIHVIMNHLVGQYKGANALTSKSLDSIASVGEYIIDMSEDFNKDIVFKALLDRIGKTIVDNREYVSEWDYIFKDAFEYGCILQKVHVDNFSARTNGAYDNLDDGDVDEDLYKMFLPSVHQTLFENSKPWEFAVTITRDQIKSAFTNEETLTAFINGIYIAMKNSIIEYLEAEARGANEVLIARKLTAAADVSQAGIHAVNPLQVYYDETGIELTQTSWQYNADFLRWLTSLFNDYKKLLGRLTVLFNVNGYQRQSTPDYLNFIIISKVADNIKRFMTADVYNQDFVSMPGYHEVTAWQAIGTSTSLADRMSVKVTYTDEDGNTQTVDKKVIGVMHDSEAIGATVKERRTVSVPNPHGNRYNLFEQGNTGHFVDLSQNAIVFYIADVVKPAS